MLMSKNNYTDEEEEEYEKKLEEARKLRNSVGMVTANDLNKTANTYTNTQTNHDENYQKKLEEARRLRNSVGMVTPKDLGATTNTYTNTSVNYDEEYENRLEEARKLRNSVGMITPKDLLKKEDNDNEIIPQTQNITTNTNVQNEQKDNNAQKENETESDKKEIVNVILNGNKPSALVTDEERKQKLIEEETMKKYSEETNSDNNIFSQIGKTIENLWLGITSGNKSFANYITDAQHTNQQENELLVGNNTLPGMVYKDELNKDSSQLIENIQNTNVNLSKNLEGLKNNNTLAWSDDTKSNDNDYVFNSSEFQDKLKNELDNARDAYGDIELSPLQRDLSKNIVEDQNKIANNINKISNPIMKKVAELTPSAGNSLFGAGLSMINEYLGMSYFMISAAGAYEADGRNRGMSKSEARAYGTIMGWAEGASEMININNLFKGAKALQKGSLKEALKTVGIDMAENVIQETIIDPIDEITAQLTSGKTKHDYSTKEGWSDLLNDMVQDGINGALSSLLMNGVNLGLNTPTYLYNKIKNGQGVNHQDIVQAYSEIFNSDNIDTAGIIKESMKYQTEKVNRNQNKYNIVETNSNGEIYKFQEVMGEEIPLKNRKLDIIPAVVYNGDFYNVIDIASGLKLDTTTYETKQEAIDGFYFKIENANNSLINTINNQVNKQKYAMFQKVQDVQNKITNNPNEVLNQNTIEFIDSNSLLSKDEAQDVLITLGIETKLNNRPYLGKELNDLISQRLINEETNQNEDKDNLNNNTTNYTSENIKSITDQFNGQDQYSKNEIADIWNNEINKNNLDVVYDDNGNIQSYIAIEESDDGLKISQYDNNDNVVRSETILPQNEKFSSESINNAIENVTGIYEQNKVQSDDMKEGISNKINNTTLIMNNYDEITRKRIEFSNRNVIVENDEQLSNLVEEALTTNENKALHLGKLNEAIIESIKNKIQNLPQNKQDFLKRTTYDLVINQSEIRHLIDNKNSLTNKDVDNFIKILPDIILNSDYISYTNNLKDEGLRFKKLMEDGTYVSFVIVSNKQGTMKVKTIYMEKEDYQNKKRSISLSSDVNMTPNNTSETNRVSTSNITNSIPQNNINVKGTVNSNFMQNDNKNTNISDNNISSLKKNTSKLEKTSNIKYNSNGIQLGKREYTNLVSAINSDNPNLPNGINYKHYGDYFYIFDKLDFNNYNFKGKIKITNNEEILNRIMKEVDNDDKTTDSIDRLLEVSKNGQSIYSSNNINVRNARTAARNGGLSSRAIQVDQTTSNARTSNLKESNRNNKSINNSKQLDKKNNIKNPLGEQREESNNNDSIRSMKNNKSSSTSNEEIRFAKRTAKNQKVQKNTDKTKLNAERDTAYIEQEIKKIEATGNWDNSIPITKLTDIRRTIEDYLGLNIKKGHFRQRAYAIYKGDRDVIRTKEYKDIDSILHETGHALDIGNRLKINKETIADELLMAIDKLGGYEKETRTLRLEEGFAEIIREYAIIPEQTKKDYPQTVAVLEKLRQNDKSFDNFITKVQQQTYNYIHQNPQNRNLNMSIGEHTDKAPLTKEGLKRKVITMLFDKGYATKVAVEELAKKQGKSYNQIKASENIYYITRLFNGVVDKAISILSDGYIDEQGNRLMPGLSQIGEILGNNPKRLNDLRAYLVSKRDLEYKEKNLKTGLRTSDSKYVIEKFKNDTEIQQASKIIYDYLDGIMQYAVNNGLISQRTADNLRQSNAFYVPMQRVIENRGNQIGKKGQVIDVIKKRTGSELDIKDVLENIVANTVNIVQQVENNNALKALYKQGEGTRLTGTIYDVITTPMKKIGTAQLSTWKKELEKQGVNVSELDLDKTIDLFAPNNKIDVLNKIISFIDDDGTRKYLQFNDDIIFNSIANINTESQKAIFTIFNTLNTPLRYGATMANLGFAIPNMISDTVQAAIYSTAGFIPIVDNALGILNVLAAQNKSVRNFMDKVMPGYADRINKLYDLYKQSGASSGTRLSQERKSTQVLMREVYGTTTLEVLGIEEKYKPLKRLLDFMTYIPQISEQSTRFQVFIKNYEYYKNKGTAEMDSRIMAALESRDATQDFSRMGTLTEDVNKIIPFSAARVGGMYTFAEKLKANPKRVGMRIAILTAIAMGIKSLGYDDDEIEELNQRKKDDNFVVRIGDNINTIKKPQGILRSIVNLAEYIQDLATDHIEEGKEGERLAEWLKNAIMDNMPTDDVAGLVPSAITPVIENALNKDFYYKTDIVKSYDLEMPDAEQYYDYNSQLAIWLGNIFNYSPAKIDNLISGYFAGLGTSITDMMDYALGKTGVIPEQPEMGAEDNAIAKRFIVNVNSNSASIDEIYDRKTELTKKKNGGTITDEETEELENITIAISNLSKLNKQIKEIKKDLTKSGTQKAEEIKVLQQEKTDTARQALGKDLIHSNNEEKIQTTSFYPTNSELKQNNYSLELTQEMKSEYSKIASEYYKKYENKGLYNSEYLDKIKTQAKTYAKNEMFKKYKAQLIKTK